MPPVDRRSFLGTTARGLAAALVTGPCIQGHDPIPGLSRLSAAFAPDTLFLTWQRDPTTTMTVQWIGPALAGTDTTITVEPAGSGTAAAVAWAKPTTRPFPYTPLSVHRAELTGLTPGTEYQFRVGSRSAAYRFRTMPRKATDAITFVSGGDCGVNPHAAAVNALAARQDPHFAVIGGDLAYDDGRSPQAMLGFVRNYARHMIDGQGRLIPMVACVGNHEVSGGYDGSRADASLFLSLFDGLFDDTSYATLDFGDYLSLVLLDSGHLAPIGGAQADWLDRALRERADRPHVFAVNHVPAYPSYRPDGGTDGTGAENREHWVPLFERHNVDVVLEHHDHTFKRTHPMWGGHVDPHGIVYLGDGSWGQLRAPVRAEERPYLAATGQAYHVSLHRLEGGHRFHMAMEESGRVVDVCSTAKRPRHR
jgi:hypothetical protein